MPAVSLEPCVGVESSALVAILAAEIQGETHPQAQTVHVGCGADELEIELDDPRGHLETVLAHELVRESGGPRRLALAIAELLAAAEFELTVSVETGENGVAPEEVVAEAIPEEKPPSEVLVPTPPEEHTSSATAAPSSRPHPSLVVLPLVRLAGLRNSLGGGATLRVESTTRSGPALGAHFRLGRWRLEQGAMVSWSALVEPGWMWSRGETRLLAGVRMGAAWTTGRTTDSGWQEEAFWAPAGDIELRGGLRIVGPVRVELGVGASVLGPAGIVHGEIVAHDIGPWLELSLGMEAFVNRSGGK